MNIAFVIHSLGMGGIETVGVNYIRLLSERGHKLTVYNLNPTEDMLVSQIPKGVDYKAVKFPRGLCPELYSYGVKKWWWGKFAYPLIHMLLKALFLPKRLLTAWLGKQYDVSIAFAGHINDLTYVADGFIKSKKKIVWCHGALLPYLAVCDGYAVLYGKVDAIVTLSDLSENNVFAGHSFLRRIPIVKIYNPVLVKERKIDTDRVEELKRKYGRFMVMVARMTPQKNHISAMEAVEILRLRGIDEKLIFVGDGENLEEYKEYALQHGLEDTVVFEGNRMDVENYFAACHIGVLNSVWEGLPTVIAECMAFGKPCVMTKSDGGEISEFGKYCLLTEVGDSAAFADAIELLYRNEAEYERYSELSLERFKDFEPENEASKLEELFKLIGVGK